MKKALSITTTCLFGIAVFLFIITFSIGLPIYCRFFYYLQIEPLQIPQNTGFSFEQIKEAYDQVLDYLTLPNATFSTGDFKFSQEGYSHFADCKKLFDLNAVTLIISSIVIISLLLLNKFNKIGLLRPFGCSVALISAISILVVGALLIIVISINFDGAFITFHHLFFPGKDNWTFHPDKDQIITALPQEFFMNCAILIGSSIIFISLFIIVFQLVKRKKQIHTNK